MRRERTNDDSLISPPCFCVSIYLCVSECARVKQEQQQSSVRDKTRNGFFFFLKLHSRGARPLLARLFTTKMIFKKIVSVFSLLPLSLSPSLSHTPPNID